MKEGFDILEMKKISMDRGATKGCILFKYTIVNKNQKFELDIRSMKNHWNLIQDLRTRDFTVNSLYYWYYNTETQIIVYRNEVKNIVFILQDLDDLNNRILKCTDKPFTVFDTDPRRILRAVRFEGQKQMIMDDDIKQFIEEHGKDKIKGRAAGVDLKKILECRNIGHDMIVKLCEKDLLPFEYKFKPSYKPAIHKILNRVDKYKDNIRSITAAEIKLMMIVFLFHKMSLVDENKAFPDRVKLFSDLGLVICNKPLEKSLDVLQKDFNLDEGLISILRIYDKIFGKGLFEKNLGLKSKKITKVNQEYNSMKFRQQILDFKKNQNFKFDRETIIAMHEEPALAKAFRFYFGKIVIQIFSDFSKNQNLFYTLINDLVNTTALKMVLGIKPKYGHFIKLFVREIWEILGSFKMNGRPISESRTMQSIYPRIMISTMFLASPTPPFKDLFGKDEAITYNHLMDIEKIIQASLTLKMYIHDDSFGVNVPNLDRNYTEWYKLIMIVILNRFVTQKGAMKA